MTHAKFKWLIVSVYFGGRGLLATLFDTAVFARLKTQYSVSGTDFQKYCTVAMLPWSLKPLFGLLSDRIALFGYHKRPYIIMVALAGATGSVALAVVNVSLSVATTVFCVFVVSLQLAVTDLLSESEYAKVIVLNPTLSAAIISGVWICIFTGQIVGASVAGLLVFKHLNTMFWCAVPLCVQIAMPAIAGCYDDKRSNTAVHDPKLVRVAFAIAVSACALGLTTLYCGWQARILLCVVSSVALLLVAIKSLPKITARCNMFLFLMCILNVQIPGALDYWYTADYSCIPNGANFQLSFFILVTGVAGAAAGALSVVLFKYTPINQWQFKTMFCVATLLRCTASLVDVAMVNRWNVRVGIPDKPFFIVGKAVLQPIVMMLEQSPAVLLTSKLCTKDNESTIYAILAGFQNYGAAVSVVIGTVLADLFQVHLSSTRCTVEYLPHLIAVANIVLPMLCIPMAIAFVPNGSTTTPGALLK